MSLMGQDEHCAAWIRKFREPAADGEGAGAGGRRGRENRRRGGVAARPGRTEGVRPPLIVADWGGAGR